MVSLCWSSLSSVASWPVGRYGRKAIVPYPYVLDCRKYIEKICVVNVFRKFNFCIWKNPILRKFIYLKMKLWAPCWKFSAVCWTAVENLQCLSKNCNYLPRLIFWTRTLLLIITVRQKTWHQTLVIKLTLIKDATTPETCCYTIPCETWMIHVSQGSVVMCFRCGGIFNNINFIANFPRSVPVKECWKSMNHGLCDSNKLLYKRCAKSMGRPKFRPLQFQHFSTDLNEPWNQERYPGYDPTCKIWLMWDHGKGVCVGRAFSVSVFYLSFFCILALA